MEVRFYLASGRQAFPDIHSALAILLKHFGKQGIILQELDEDDALKFQTALASDYQDEEVVPASLDIPQEEHPVEDTLVMADGRSFKVSALPAEVQAVLAQHAGVLAAVPAEEESPSNVEAPSDVAQSDDAPSPSDASPASEQEPASTQEVPAQPEEAKGESQEAVS